MHGSSEQATAFRDIAGMERNTVTPDLWNVTGSDVIIGSNYRTVMLIETYCMPIICIFGLIGNSLAIITFLQSPLRNTSSGLYLAVRSMSDNGFLFTLSLIWISRTFNLCLSRVLGVCQMTIFLTYVCGSISVWLVVVITAENYVRICHPFIVKSICATRPAKVVISVLVAASLALYHFPLWISNPDCSHNPKYYEITQALVYTDTVLTLIIPSVIITVLMAAVTYTVAKTYHQARRVKRLYVLKSRQSTYHGRPAAKVTRMLFAVSLSYFVLNLPSHMIRLRLLINSIMKRTQIVSSAEADIQSVFLLIYYLSFAVNIIIYFSLGSNFRRTFLETFHICKTRRTPVRLNCEAVNLAPARRRFSLQNEKETESNLLIVPRPTRCHSH